MKKPLLGNRDRLFYLFPVFLILYEFCTNMSNDMYLPALPIIAQNFITPIHWVQLTITAWIAGSTTVELFVGPLSDRYGRRPILFGGGALFLISTLGCTLAPSLGFLIGARFLQGISVCTMMIAGYASIHDLYDDRKAVHILVWMGSAAVIAPAIGPVFGGLLLLITGWRMIFFTLFILGAISLVALWFIMPESTKTSSSERKSFKIKNIILSYRRIFSNPHFMMSAASFGLLYAGVMGWITTSPYILMKTLHMTPTEFGYMQVPIFGAYIIGAQLVKPLMKRMSSDKLIVLGLSIAALAGIALINFASFAPMTPLSFVIPMSFYGLGFGFASAPLNRATVNATPEQKGSAMSVFYLMMTGSGTIVSLVLSIFGKGVLYPAFVIAAAVFLAFILNFVRKNRLA